MSDAPYTCPECGHGVAELPEAVVIEDGPHAGTTKGHSDQSTHVCPACDHEGWRQGWVMDKYPEPEPEDSDDP